jgi:small subunit ribosomal protein S9
MAKKTSDIKYYESVGRRKSSSAIVRLYILGKQKEVTVGDLKMKTGETFINNRPVKEYFPKEVQQNEYLIPLKLTSNLDRFAISAKISGGGKMGQLDAFIHGLSRAIELSDTTLRPTLKKQGLLTRDARVKEKRKVGTGGKARRQKQSPKR